MKKKKQPLLNLNKKSISNLDSKQLGGRNSDIVLTVYYPPVQISSAPDSCLSPCGGTLATLDCYVKTDGCIYV